MKKREFREYMKRFLKKQLHMKKAPRGFNKRWDNVCKNLIKLIGDQKEFSLLVFDKLKDTPEEEKLNFVRAVIATSIATYIDEVTPEEERKEILRIVNELIGLKQKKEELNYIYKCN